MYKIANELINYIRNNNKINKIKLVGSLARHENIDNNTDIDICIATTNKLNNLPGEKLNDGEKLIKLLYKNTNIDIFVVEPKYFPLTYFLFKLEKGKAIYYRKLCKQNGYKLSQYGIQNIKTNKIWIPKTQKNIKEFLNKLKLKK